MKLAFYHNVPFGGASREIQGHTTHFASGERSRVSLDFSGYLLQAVPDVYPLVLTLGSWRLYAYDAMLVVAFLAAIELGNRRCRQRGVLMPVVYRGEILLFLSGYLGSQLLELGMAWRGGYPGWLGDVLVGSDAKAFCSGSLAASSCSPC